MYYVYQIVPIYSYYDNIVLTSSLVDDVFGHAILKTINNYTKRVKYVYNITTTKMLKKDDSYNIIYV